MEMTKMDRMTDEKGREFRVGDVIRTIDGAHVRITDVLFDIKGMRGAYGVTVFDPDGGGHRPTRANSDGSPDRWVHLERCEIVRSVA